jgi:hypothetical protein
MLSPSGGPAVHTGAPREHPHVLRHAEFLCRRDRIVAGTPASPEARRLHNRLIRHRKHLFVFVTDRDVPPTNNISERHLRPSVIFRKVTNGFRAEWGSETYAAYRTVASTARQTGKTVLQAIADALAPQANPNPGLAITLQAVYTWRSNRSIGITVLAQQEAQDGK